MKKQTRDDSSTNQNQASMFEDFFQGSSLPMFILDMGVDGRFRFTGINPAAENVWNVDSSRIFGGLLTETAISAREDSGADLEEKASLCAREFRVIQFEETFVLAGEKTRWITTLTPAKMVEGRLKRIMGTSVEITRLDKEYRDTRNRERKYRSLIHGARDAIFSVNYDGVFRYMNLEAAQQMGVDPDVGPGKTMWDFFPKPVADRQMENVRKVLDSGKPMEIENMSLVQGEHRWYSTTLQVVYEEDDDRGYVLGIAREITERVKNRETLKMLSAAIDQSPVLVVITDDKGVVEYVNPYYIEITGFEKDDVIGEKIEKVCTMPLEKREGIWETVISRGIWQGTSKNKSKNGATYWEYATISAVRDKNGQVTHFIKIAEDISSRLKTEEELASHQRFIDRILDTTPNIIYIQDMLQGRNIFSNKSIEEMLGFSIKEIQAWGADLYKKLVHPDDYQRVVYFQKEVLSARDGESLDIEYRVKDAAGNWRWLYSRESVFLRDKSGAVVQKMGTAMDITERKHAEADALAGVQNAERAAVIEAMGDGVVVVTMNGEVNLANPAIEKMIGYGKNELLEKNIADLIPAIIAKEDREKAFETLSASYNASAISPMELSLVSKNKEIVPVILTVAYLRDENGEPMRIVANFKEISEMKNARDRLNKFLVELERSNKELEHFAYVASHDLQEPLRMVTSYLQLLERRYKDRLDENARDFIFYAVDGAGRMRKLIDALLSYSRVGTHGKPFAPTDLNEIFANTLRVLELAIEDSGAVIHTDPLPVVVTDETQMGQLFQNLLSNAIKFKGDNPPEIRISSRKDNDHWVFCISDNGIGIEKKDHDRIFAIFQRLHARDQYPGTGIGLSLVKKIIERHGGNIWLESSLGKGSAFYFTLPMISNKGEEDHD